MQVVFPRTEDGAEEFPIHTQNDAPALEQHKLAFCFIPEQPLTFMLTADWLEPLSFPRGPSLGPSTARSPSFINHCLPLMFILLVSPLSLSWLVQEKWSYDEVRWIRTAQEIPAKSITCPGIGRLKSRFKLPWGPGNTKLWECVQWLLLCDKAFGNCAEEKTRLCCSG